MPVALRSATFAVAAVALLGTAATGHAQEPIRIGVLLPLTGPLAKNGLENWEAMQIARDMINERGGINGRKIEYLQGDANTPNAAISETERLITKDGIKITTGSLLRRSRLRSARPPSVTAYSTGRRRARPRSSPRRGFKHTFQVGAPARKYGQAAVDFIVDDLAKRLNKPVDDLQDRACCGKTARSANRSATAFAPIRQSKGIKLAYDEGYDQSATDMTPIVQKLKDVDARHRDRDLVSQ